VSEIRGRGITTGKHVVQDALLRQPETVRRYDSGASGGAAKTRADRFRQGAPADRPSVRKKLAPPR
jgi:hypothetical protein